MNQKIMKMPKQSVVVNAGVSVFVRISESNKRANIGKIKGLLKEYRKKYASVEL